MPRSPTKIEVPAYIRIRPMRMSDLPGVYRLEAMSQPVPWPRWCFRTLLRKKASCWVLEVGDEIIGFGIVDFVKECAHIMNMCVVPEYRRRGLGRRIMLHLLDVARQHRCKRAWLEVRPNNRPAILLYRKLGFRTKRIRKGYYRYQARRQNGLLMARLVRAFLAGKGAAP